MRNLLAALRPLRSFQTTFGCLTSCPSPGQSDTALGGGPALAIGGIGESLPVAVDARQTQRRQQSGEHGGGLVGQLVDTRWDNGTAAPEGLTLTAKRPLRGDLLGVVVERRKDMAQEGVTIPLCFVSRVDAYQCMIQSAKVKLVEQALAGNPGKGFPNDIFRAAVRKLAMLEAAVKLDDLGAPPGNRLKALSDDREGQHSIRINDQWRICFAWTDNGPEGVEIVDYH